MKHLLLFLANFLIGAIGFAQTLTVDGTGTGRVGIRDNTPNFTLTVQHGNGTPAAGNTNGLEILNQGGGSSWVIYAGSTGALANDLVFYRNGVVELTIDDAMGPTVVSDQNAKTNILPIISGQLAKIMQLQPKSYRYIRSTTDKMTAGFLAQEVVTVFPEAVRYVEKDDEGKESWMMSYPTLIPFMVKAMQEQQTIIETQQTEIETLKRNQQDILRRLEKLENR